MTRAIQTEEPRKFKAGDELRRRLLEAASRLFGEFGYERVSIRSIAQEVGCSQMAMYRHFPDKEALIRHLCTELYQQFTTQLHDRYDHLPEPRERLRQALRNFVLLSVRNPHHYRLTFLAPALDELGLEMRHAAANPAISYFRKNLKLALPPGCSDKLVEERLHQILATLHGMTVMLITHPRAYKLSRDAALRQLDSAFEIFLNAPENAGMRG